MISRDLLNRLKKTPHIRIALIAAIASILLVSGIATVGLPKASAKSEIHATGTSSTVTLLPDVAQRTSGDLFAQFRILRTDYDGTLKGTSILFNLGAANATSNKAFGANYLTFTGRVGNSEPGTFSAISMFTSDRSACPCPPGMITVSNTFVVIEGTGQGGLKDICGSGTTSAIGNAVAGFTSTYDITFRFGKDCKANN